MAIMDIMVSGLVRIDINVPLLCVVVVVVDVVGDMFIVISNVFSLMFLRLSIYLNTTGSFTCVSVVLSSCRFIVNVVGVLTSMFPMYTDLDPKGCIGRFSSIGVAYIAYAVDVPTFVIVMVIEKGVFGLGDAGIIATSVNVNSMNPLNSIVICRVSLTDTSLAVS